jgi:uncharacterized surface protein with fasciclin (FAS1) repeats
MSGAKSCTLLGLVLLLAIVSAEEALLSVSDLLYNRSDLSTMSQLFDFTWGFGLYGTSDAPLTLFCPNNDAFSNFEDYELLQLFVTSSAHRLLLDLWIGYHMVPNQVLYSSNLTIGAQSLPTLGAVASGQANLTVFNEQSVWYVEDGRPVNVSVVEANVVADHGVVHVIQDLLVPDFLTATLADQLNSNSPSSKNITKFYQLLILTGLISTLSQPGPFTVLAPDDIAFDRLNDATWQALIDPDNLATLTNIMRYHILDGLYTIEYSKPELIAPSLLVNDKGQPYLVQIDTAERPLRVNGNQANMTGDGDDILARNGVIHILRGLLSPFNETNNQTTGLISYAPTSAPNNGIVPPIVTTGGSGIVLPPRNDTIPSPVTTDRSSTGRVAHSWGPTGIALCVLAGILGIV